MMVIVVVMLTLRNFGHVSTYSQFDGFSPTGGLLQGWRLVDNQNQERSFQTQKLQHRETFTHGSFCTEAFTQRSFYTQTRQLLHRGAFMHRSFYAEKSLHTGAFTGKCFFTEK